MELMSKNFEHRNSLSGNLVNKSHQCGYIFCPYSALSSNSYSIMY